MLTPSRPARAVVMSSLALAVNTWLGACSKPDAASDSARAADSAAAPATSMAPPDTVKPAAAALNDAQIAHIAVTASSIDSAAGVVAKQKGSAKSVKDFAQTMIDDHTAVNKQAVALATKLGVTPEDNDVSRSLKSSADASTSTLQGRTAADFDRGYIDNEVAYHQAVLDALDKTLIPGAQNAELKALLEKARPSFAAHLARAKDIQSSLNR